MLRALFFALCFSASASAQTLPLLGVGGSGSSGAALDPATTAWVNAVTTAGGTVSTGQKGFVNTLIVGLKTSFGTNYFTSCDRIWLLASENTQQATIDIVNLGTLTPHNSPTFTANQGYAGNGTSSYLDTSFQSGTNYLATSASFSVYDRTSRTGALAAYILGSQNGTQSTSLLPQSGASQSIGAINSTTALFPVTGNAQGFYLVTTSASLEALYLNGSSTAASSSAVSGQTLPADNIFILATNFVGSPASFQTDQAGEVSLCGNFTGVQSSQFQGLINAYMTSVGANVY